MEVNKNKDEYINFGDAHADFLDLLIREEKSTDLALAYVDEYLAYTDGRKVTTVILFDTSGAFIGSGTAVKSPKDNYDKVHGTRIAFRKALRSVTGHEKRPGGKRVRMNG
jgi:hypothetical protein